MQRVALVGAGGIGRFHAGAYVRMPDAELVGVVDILPEAAEKYSQEFSVKPFKSIGELLAEVEVDVFDICTPTPSHAELIIEAAAAGKHVVSEKPLSRTAGQAEDAVEACANAGVRLFVAHVLRWFPEYRRMHDLIVNGAVGDVAVVRSSRCGGSPGRWFADMKASGGVVLDLIIHDFDWLRWTLGKVDRVYARGLYENSVAGADYALVTLHFASGAIAHVEGSWARPGGFETSAEIAGSEGLLSFSSTDSSPFQMQLRGKDGARTGMIVPESPSAVDPYYLELEHFINCLEEDRTPDVTGEDGLEAVRISEAVLQSISRGKPVAL